VLGKIVTPSLVLHADDDPMVPEEAVWPALKHASSHVECIRHQSGGHLGGVSGWSREGWIHTEALKATTKFFARF
jgi:predicted alpha/beta-fold hydrolase